MVSKPGTEHHGSAQKHYDQHDDDSSIHVFLSPFLESASEIVIKLGDRIDFFCDSLNIISDSYEQNLARLDNNVTCPRVAIPRLPY